VKAALVLASKVAVGTRLVTDGGFTCLGDHATRVVRADKRGELYISCSHGTHLLDGQFDGSGKFYVGFWIKGTEPRKGKQKYKGGRRVRT
jgi:hypothetical protein